MYELKRDEFIGSLVLDCRHSEALVCGVDDARVHGRQQLHQTLPVGHDVNLKGTAHNIFFTFSCQMVNLLTEE